jgi:hypothetical protein
MPLGHILNEKCEEGCLGCFRNFLVAGVQNAIMAYLGSKTILFPLNW